MLRRKQYKATYQWIDVLWLTHLSVIVVWLNETLQQFVIGKRLRSETFFRCNQKEQEQYERLTVTNQKAKSGDIAFLPNV